MRKLLNEPTLEFFPNQQSEQTIIKRKIQLKGQHLKLIKNEREELKGKLCLVKLKEHYEAQIGESFDPTLSKKLDCIIYLLKN